MNYRSKLLFLNTTTSMPFDIELEKYFYEKFNKKVFDTYRRSGFLDGLSVFFVSEDELNQNLQEIERHSEYIFNPDLLGVYFPYHQSIRNELIMISPEKIMECAYRMCTKQTSDELLTIYKVLLVKVILHEIAHALMAANDEHEEHMSKRSYEWIARNWIENNQIDLRWFQDKSHHHHRHPDHYRQFNWYKLIEESLANYFVFFHKFEPNELEIIENFIKQQPPGYKDAFRWSPNKRKLFDNWREFKKTNWRQFRSELNSNIGQFKFLDTIYHLFYSHEYKYSFDEENIFYCISNLNMWTNKVISTTPINVDCIEHLSDIYLDIVRYYENKNMQNELETLLNQTLFNQWIDEIGDRWSLWYGAKFFTKIGNHQKACDLYDKYINLVGQTDLNLDDLEKICECYRINGKNYQSLAKDGLARALHHINNGYTARGYIESKEYFESIL